MNAAQSYLILLLHQISNHCTHHSLCRCFVLYSVEACKLFFGIVFVDATLVRLPAMVFVSMNCLRIGYGTLSGLDYVCTVVGGIES